MSKHRARIAVCFAVLVVAAACWLVASRRGSSALGKLEALGLPVTPGQLNAWYAPVPSSSNLATVLLSAASLVRTPRNLTNMPFFGNYGVPPGRVDSGLLGQWRNELEGNAGAFQAIAAGRELTSSRYPIDLNSGTGTLLPHLSQLKHLARILALGAVTEAESGNGAAALQDIGDIILVARSLDHEPTVISQLVRSSLLETAALAAANSLGRVKLEPGAWRDLQAKFTEAEAADSFGMGVAGTIALLNRPDPGSELRRLSGGRPPTGSVRFQAFLFNILGFSQADRRYCIDSFEQLYEISQLPFPEGLHRARILQAQVNSGNRQHLPLSSEMLPSLALTMNSHATGQAVVDTARVGCAVERFRISHAGRLPVTLAELVPDYIKSIPTDPFDGEPLRYQHTASAFVIYSVGPDLKDDSQEPLPAAGMTNNSPADDVVFRIIH